mgnify:CR=1 FL=1
MKDIISGPKTIYDSLKKKYPSAKYTSIIEGNRKNKFSVQFKQSSQKFIEEYIDFALREGFGFRSELVRTILRERKQSELIMSAVNKIIKEKKSHGKDNHPKES